ncbi:hypothetical protein MBLNU230_g3255t1 [Neophaeotheca triangularis]
MSNQAAFIDGKGQPTQVREAPFPKPGADEIVVKNHSLAINPVDWKIQDTGMYVQKYPIVVGCDVAGEVHEVGSGVSRFKKGDRVTAHCHGLTTQVPEDNAFALYTRVKAGKTAAIPSSLSYNDACVIPLALDTAAVGLYKSFGLPQPSHSPKPAGKTVVLWGGSSSVGILVTQLAAASGIDVVSLASAKNHELCKSVGAKAVVDYKSATVVDDVVKAVKDLPSSEFVGLYDAISEKEASQDPSMQILSKLGGGHYAAVLPISAEVPANVKTHQLFGIDESTHPIWENWVEKALESGQLKCLPPPVVKGKGLQGVEAAMDANRQGLSAQKAVVEL